MIFFKTFQKNLIEKINNAWISQQYGGLLQKVLSTLKKLLSGF